MSSNQGMITVAYRGRLEDKIRRKQQEILDYEARIAEARAYVEGLQDALRLLPRENSDGQAETAIRSGSKVNKTMLLLKREGKPMHVSDILTSLGIDPTKNERVSLSGSLGAYVRRGQVFNRPAPNVFGLIGMEIESADPGPPEGFGETDVSDDFKDIDF